MNSPALSGTSTKKQKIHFHFVDSLRGIGVTWVVLYHIYATRRLVELSKIIPDWLENVLFKWGSLGVAIFFVLSGFVIAHSLRTATINPSYVGRFSLRRLIRLSPPYYVAILLALVFALLSSVVQNEAFAPMNQAFSTGRLVAHLFYVHEFFGFKSFDNIYWTLNLEIQFYLVFCTLLGLAQWLDKLNSKEWGKAIVFVPTAILAVTYPLGIFTDNGLGAVLFFPLYYGFLLGIFAYWCWQGNLKSIYFYLYAAVILAGGIINSSLFAITCVIVSTLLLEVGKANRMQDLLNWQPLQFLGRISYSLYLTHNIVVGSVLFLVFKFLKANLFTELICLVVAVVVSLVFAAIIYELAEKPSIKMSRKVKLRENTEAIKA
ncbi:MAG: acyltransferase [Richelia sp. RM2_1_2]|nr:acyltransferase [Richelia sp. SM1_7_0]NJN09660.1 acyltransferase [Richelia sp. RM1_1_1]NJO27968.1 acyltransferase [Richelia sp. SL_2_1]NJO57232.1 acyltransferase [Richelia sp. RM2_1_2]